MRASAGKYHEGMGPNPEDFLAKSDYEFSPRPEAERARTEVDHRHARYEVERLHLIVRLVSAIEGRQGG